MKFIKAELLREFTTALFKKTGITNTVAQDVTDALIQTSLRGVDSHGVRLVPHYIRAIKLGRINPRPKISFQKTAGATGIVDADNGHGIYAGLFAMRKAISLAKKQGISAVTVTHSTHFGAAGIYALEAADNDMIGLSFTHSDALVVPHGGTNPVLGTNPIAFAAPCTGEEPVCLDMATSQISWNKLLMHRASREVLPHGVAVDANGMETQDPMTANALLPLGGYKGYGLALMVDVFSGLLAGMPFGLGVSRMFPV
ncbi:MAG: Ldh family oxidoreductase, partial [Patescibacteria group bacterium]